MDRCLLFSFVYLVTEVILALSIKCRKKANQNSGILPSLALLKKILSVRVLVHEKKLLLGLKGKESKIACG